MSYRAPLNEMLFTLRHVAAIDTIAALPGLEDSNFETAQAVLEECARFNSEVIAPLNHSGDIEPATLADGVVTTSPGFRSAFEQFGAAGWQGIQHSAEHGGQGLAKLVATPCMEMLHAANMSFALAPLLTDGAIEALIVAGSPEQQASFVPNMVAGKWTGTMNLTESQAGSDLAVVRTRATPQADGSYRIFGEKIFITYGEHDLAENIIHLVLARIDGAPPGVKGISLFVVPKFLVGDDGSLGERNDVWCPSIEHKLGIKASPTSVLLFGDGKFPVGSAGDETAGAIGYLVGKENRGLEHMFVMMNAARFGVGLQGVAISDRAYQKALGYARERTQSRDIAGSSGPVTIIHHPDVRRMLMTMKAGTEAMRALAYFTAAASDQAAHAADGDERARSQALYEYLVPIVKGWSTEMAVEIASLGVQVHGGMGFVEETGAAQYYRDARILPIYEGTTAIQANDLIGRKTVRDAGATARVLIAAIRATEEELDARSGEHFAVIGERLGAGRAALEAVVEFVVQEFRNDIRAVFAGSVPYLHLAGIVLGGWQMARAALAADDELHGDGADQAFLNAKIATARFYADHLLTRAPGLGTTVVAGAAGVLALDEEQFG